MPFDGTTLSPWQVTLLKAADIVEERGLSEDGYGTDGYPRCAYGAIAEAIGIKVNQHRMPPEELYTHPAARALIAILPTTEGDEGSGNYARIPRWNDRLGQTAANVASVMRSCAMKG